MYIKHDKKDIGIHEQLEPLGCGKVIIKSIRFEYKALVDDIDLLFLSEWCTDGCAIHFCSVLKYLLQQNKIEQMERLGAELVNLENILQTIFNGMYQSQQFSGKEMAKYSFTFTPASAINSKNPKFLQLIRFLETIHVSKIRCTVEYGFVLDQVLLEQKARTFYESVQGRWIYYKGCLVQIIECNGQYYYHKDCSYASEKNRYQKRLNFPISERELVCLHYEGSGI